MVRQGQVTAQQARRKAVNKESFARAS